jgi:hypothetical protein
MALFRNFGVNQRNRLCGVQNRPPPRNAADFLELAENCTFLDRKLTSALNKIVDGHKSYFGRRCIPSGCVAKTPNVQIFLRFRALPAGRLNAQKLRTYFFANPKAGRVGSRRQLALEAARRWAGPAVFRAIDGRASNPLTSSIWDFYNRYVAHGVHGHMILPVGWKECLTLEYSKFLHYPG